MGEIKGGPTSKTKGGARRLVVAGPVGSAPEWVRKVDSGEKGYHIHDQ